MNSQKKRSSENSESTVKKTAKQDLINKGHSYQGYRVQSNHTKLEKVAIDKISAEEFQKKYILAHKPVIITGIIPELDVKDFQTDNIEKTLSYEKELQVERKIDGGFGSGHERLRMKFDEFMDRLKNGEKDLYLTTQYDDDDTKENKQQLDDDQDPDQVGEEEEEEEDDDDEDEENDKGFLEDVQFSDTDSIDLNDLHDDFVDSELDLDEEDKEQQQQLNRDMTEDEFSSILQPPLTNLSGLIPMKPTLFDILIPQQINLWIGSSISSSAQLPSFEIDKTKPNYGVGRHLPNDIGTSSGLHHDHSDNLYIPIQGRKRFTLFSPFDADSLYTIGDIYKVYENGVIDYEINENAPNWNHVRSDGVVIETKSEKENEKKKVDTVTTNIDPPSFSKIPPYYIHLEDVKDKNLQRQLMTDFQNKFPKLVSLNKISVELSVGEMLFLPCGWFHEVTSYGDADPAIHILMNYWFVPPDNDNLIKPYKYSI